MEFLRTNKRIGLYLSLLAILALGALVAVWSVTGTGAYLTGEGNWQTLAGDYRIGIIDYTVRVNDELLLGRESDGVLSPYKLAVPLPGAVRMYDSTVTSDRVRAQEFNEGAALMRVRVINYSKNTVDVSAQFTLVPGESGMMVLPLPTTLDEGTAKNFNSRQHVLKTLGLSTSVLDTLTAEQERTLLAALRAAYNQQPTAMTQEMGLLPGSTGVKPEAENVILDGSTYCYYRDVFFLVWDEYGDGTYNVDDAAVSTRQSYFKALFTVGQLD